MVYFVRYILSAIFYPVYFVRYLFWDIFCSVDFIRVYFVQIYFVPVYFIQVSFFLAPFNRVECYGAVWTLTYPCIHLLRKVTRKKWMVLEIPFFADFLHIDKGSLPINF